MNITKVAKLDETEEFQMEWSGEPVWFKARKSNLTPGFLRQVGSVFTYPEAIASVLTDWDIYSDDEGTKWPLTVAELEKLPVEFLDAILNKISESWTGDKKKQEASQSGSAAAAK